jgi:hypothetical protein
MRKIKLALAFTLVLAVGPLAQNAQAWVGVRIGIGVPLYVGPGPYYYGGYPYYYPPPVYVAPAPAVVYQTAPPAVVVRSSSPDTSEPIPAPQSPPAPIPVPPSSAPPAAYAPPVISNVVPVSNQSSPQVDAAVRRLSDGNETVRRDAAIELGRLKALSAVDALASVLTKDPSPIARDGAARGLGLIASPRCLNALIYAAQADNDREVRHSAQFAVEAIRSSLRGNQ